MSLHLSAPGLYAGQSTVQCKVDVTANLHRHTTSDIHTMITSCDLPTMGIVTTGQSNLIKRPRRRRTWMVQSCSQVAPMCTPSNTCFPGPTPLMACRLVQPFFHSSWQSIQILHNGLPFPPQNCRCAWGNLDPCLLHVSMGPTPLASQMAS